ncbi:hypothetical protein Trydic_g13513 [Trypoxylus dichotomus]
MSWMKRPSNPIKYNSSLQEYPAEYEDNGCSNTFLDDASLDSATLGSHPRPLTSEITAPRIDSYRFSMANLEDAPDVDLDAILGELCALESQCEKEIGHAQENKRLLDRPKIQHHSRTHSRSLSEEARLKQNGGEMEVLYHADSVRTDSPDNDSAFSDTVSMLSSESSTSSGGSGSKLQPLHHMQKQQDATNKIKAEKIKMAMEKIKEANIQKLFVKVFTVDGSAKSLLVDEKMSCAYVTRVLADKNHVGMDPKWAIVEYIPDLYMERIYEDHELLVDNLMLWARDSKNKILFVERPEKTLLFMQPEKFLLSSTDKQKSMENDEHSRTMLVEEFFSSNTRIPEVEGPLYLKSESKKGWKKHYFVLRASGLYYFQKEKVRSAKDLICLMTFESNQVYYGLGWKKKFKAPTDYCFGIKHPKVQDPKSSKFIKYLCAEDKHTLEQWIVGIRIAKYGARLMDNYRMLVDELAQEDLDILAHARSCSISSIAVQSNVTTPVQSFNPGEGYSAQSETYAAPSDISVGRHSRASSSSSSGCMSDGASSTCENAFDSEFSTGTIKRKPSMKPSLPLTSTTRQLKEVGETRDENDTTSASGSPVTTYTSTGTLTKRHHRRKSNNSGDDSSNCSTLKRQHSCKSRGSMESMGSCSGNSTPLGNTPVREHSAASIAEATGMFPAERMANDGFATKSPPNNVEDIPLSMTDSIISLPPPPDTTEDNIVTSPTYQLPPPPQELFHSNLSLDSLPPPPNLSDLPSISESELTGSQLSLMSLPPPPPSETGAVRKRLGSTTPTPTNPDGYSSDYASAQSNSNTPTYNSPSFYHQAPPATPQPIYNQGQSSTLPCGYSGMRSSLKEAPQQQMVNSGPAAITPGGGSGNSATLPYSSGNVTSRTSIQSLNLQHVSSCGEPQSPKKLTKKISFNLAPQEVPALPKKPLPPKRSDSTRLSSPRKLTDPPTEFLRDLQRVMRKKWQVAQKCKEEPSTTPYEVLGFRDPPAMLPDYKETNVSNWVKEHYGPNNLYENVYRDNQDAVVEYATSPVHSRNENKIYEFIRCKRPPPPPPKRSELTHLSTTKTH